MNERPPAHPAFTAPSEYVTRAWGEPSRLTDRERSLLFRLAIHNLCRQFPGCTEEDAAEALDHFAALGKSHITGDQHDVYLIVNDQVHIHAERAWLRWAAHGSGASRARTSPRVSLPTVSGVFFPHHLC